MNRITYLRNELTIAHRKLTNATVSAQQMQDDLVKQVVATGETVAELDAAVLELEYQNALLTLGITEG